MPDSGAFHGSSLCVVGNINRDIKTSPIPAGPHLLSDGETPVSDIAETIGGGGANSAFAAAALGGRVAFLGKVGADVLGERLRRTLTRHDISAHLARDPLHGSGSSLALTYDNGHRHFVSCLPANEALCFADLDLTALSTCRHLLRADVWFSKAMLFEGNLPLLKAAQAASLKTSVDINWDPQWGHASASQIHDRKAALRAVLPWVNLAHGNVRELMEFADAPDLDTALKSLTTWGASAVVVHMGSKGAGYYSRGDFILEPPAPIIRQTHATGTGDVLSVCMMLLDQNPDLSIPDRLKLSNQVVAQFMEGKLTLIPSLED